LQRAKKAFRRAVFMVSCDFKFKDVVFDESVWPEGCELMDWVFYNRTCPAASSVAEGT